MQHQPLVLIVDDDDNTRGVLAVIFERMGFATCEADNNTDALAQALAQHPDLITTDIGRPGGSGFEFIQEIRATTAVQDIPIVVISGAITQEDRKLTERLGPTLTMRKPFEPSEFYAAIEKFIPKDQWQIDRLPKWGSERE